MSSGILVGALVGAVIVLVMMAVAMTRKVSAMTVEQTARRLSVVTPLPPPAAFEKIRTARWRKLKVVDSDAARGVLVLASPTTFFSWGFFYPVFFKPSRAGTTIEVGVKSRAAQWGPVVTNNHKAAMAEIEAALSS